MILTNSGQAYCYCGVLLVHQPPWSCVQRCDDDGAGYVAERCRCREVRLKEKYLIFCDIDIKRASVFSLRRIRIERTVG